MRYISKTNRCLAFDAYAKPAGWSGFDSSVKLTLHQHLLAEQQHLCIYCQQSIPKKTQKDDHFASPPVLHPSHIEHIRPKDAGQFPHLSFEYTNLSVSCNGFDIDAATAATPDFCGHPKASQFDDTRFLHPIEETGIETFFEYDLNGDIKPSVQDPAKAIYTIQLLGLEKETLREMRERQYDVVLESVNSGALDITAYLDPAQPELPKFFSMLRQLFGLA